MRLLINRDQAKGMLGGVKVRTGSEGTTYEREAELVRKYKAEKETLLKKEIKIPLTGRGVGSKSHDRLVTLGSDLQV